MSKATYKILKDEYIPVSVSVNGFETPVWIQQLTPEGKYQSPLRYSGCGHSCNAMALSLRGKPTTPQQEIEFCVKRWGEPSVSSSGKKQYWFLSITGMVEILNACGLNAKCYGVSEQTPKTATEHIVSALNEGKLVTIVSSPSESFKENPFSTGDHYVLLLGFTSDGKILVANSSLNGVYDKCVGVQEVDSETIMRALNPAGSPKQKTWGELENLFEGIGYVIID